MLRLCAVVLMLVVCAQAFPAVREKRDLMTIQQLNALYNTGVDTAELVVRPKGNQPNDATAFYQTHSGVRVTLTDGGKFLIHKGLDYGQCTKRFDIKNLRTLVTVMICSDTVVTPESDMTGRWREPQEIKHFGGRKTVRDFVRAGGRYYNFVDDNCHHAARRMMDL